MGDQPPALSARRDRQSAGALPRTQAVDGPVLPLVPGGDRSPGHPDADRARADAALAGPELLHRGAQYTPHALLLRPLPLHPHRMAALRCRSKAARRLRYASQACGSRRREELGGVSAAEWPNARKGPRTTTIFVTHAGVHGGGSPGLGDAASTGFNQANPEPSI